MLCQGVGASRQPSRCEEDYEDGPARWPQARMREAVSASPTLCGSVVSSLHVRARRAKEEILRAARTKTSSLCAGDERTSSILIQQVNARVICSFTTSPEGLSFDLLSVQSPCCSWSRIASADHMRATRFCQWSYHPNPRLRRHPLGRRSAGVCQSVNLAHW